MNPKEQNIIETLNLLTMVHHSQKQTPQLTKEQKHILTVTKEHIAEAGLSIPVFINTLKILSNKGYLYTVSIFEDKYHLALQEFSKGKNAQKLLKEIKDSDKDALMQKIKESVTTHLEKIIPSDLKVQRQEIMDDPINFDTVVTDILPLISQHSNEDTSIIFLLPFRSIDRLLEKMNDGQKFDEVQDAGIWYDPADYTFHIGDDIISTLYNNKPNKEHFILQALFKTGVSSIGYDEIPEFDSSKYEEVEMKSFFDAFLRFIKKHPKLPHIFKIYKYHLDINKEYIEHTH